MTRVIVCGTWDMVRRAKAKGIEVKVVQPSKESK